MQPRIFCNVFFICYLAAPRSTLAHCQGDSLTNWMSITAFLLLMSTQGSPGADYLVGFELEICQF